MTVTFDLPPQVELAYREIAEAKGVPIDTLVREVVIAGFRPASAASSQERLDQGSRSLLTNAERRNLEGRKSLVEIFDELPLKGLDLDFSPNRSSARTTSPVG